MIKRILIANRGEIALRVMRTCRKLNIETVSLYADNDASLPHAKSADININLGSGTLAQTYLNQEKIIEIAKAHDVDAIHPGYGFLSENKSFCEKVTKAGLIFIGPTPEAIELMGDKKASKVKMEEINIPLVPGYHGEAQDNDTLVSEAKKIGFPILIKATAGGGGKGMRIVHDEKDFASELDAAKREALNAFSNDKVLLEKYIINPRHIEVQLVSDGQGQHFHFFERECSIQRRYQKVIEEAPAAKMSEELRARFCECAVNIAKGINYKGAGTIEFILDQSGEFYFLEMNTRLQVEHPVTEMITGVDLVELQIKAAQGEKFSFKQEDLRIKGHALECRLYAENPDNNFFPTNGKIFKIQRPARTNYRLDCGYIDGNSVATQYDPMLAKLIVHSKDRVSCIEKMDDALESVIFGGVVTNRDYLRRILNEDIFKSGDIHTHYIPQMSEKLKKEKLGPIDVLKIASASMLFDKKDIKNVWDYNVASFDKKILIGSEEYEVKVEYLDAKKSRMSFDSSRLEVEVVKREQDYLELDIEGEIFRASRFMMSDDGQFQIFLGHSEAHVKLIPKARVKTNNLTASEDSVQSPMPGKVFKILMKKGEKVQRGDAVLIVEAMKMEHTIKSPKDGVIKEFFFQEGEQVQGGAPLCDIV